MKISLAWLRDWVDVPWSARELGERLTMAGFELESLTAAAPEFSGVIVAEILGVEPHPRADKLKVCRVGIGNGDTLQIVCGAANARVGLHAPLARVGARLPDGPEIGAAQLRGVESAGMLCSARELGLAEASAGLLELPAAAPPGASLRDYLGLDDPILELNVTPNRGDAMSVLGIAREVAALARRPLKGPHLAAVAAPLPDTVPVRLEWPEACPAFAARVVSAVDNRRDTPLWMRERLRRAGVRSISPVVDVTNYVLLELGSPMHAYDRARLVGGVHARRARAAEPLTLLDGKSLALVGDELVIADDAGAVGLAGIMGGARTAVTPDTSEVVLEAAWFAPAYVAGRARRHGLQTDASQRFERGVDPSGLERALERATALLLEVAGGRAGPPVFCRFKPLAPRPAIALRRARITRLLGLPVPDTEVDARLGALGLELEVTGEGWRAIPPPHRFDLAIEADLIEEVARLGGLESIPETAALVPQTVRPRPEGRAAEGAVLGALAARGYREAIHFAFVDPALQRRLFPAQPGLALSNPIASDLAVMRVSLWPGLLRSTLENQHRQQERVRLFEHGVRFLADPGGGASVESDALAGIAVGPRHAEQWGLPRDPVDFHDVKGDLESLFSATGESASFALEAATLECLRPGRSARILHRDQAVGWIGELHPGIASELGFVQAPILFEIDYAAIATRSQASYQPVSRFPQVRRDLAVLVDDDLPLSAVYDCVTFASGGLLRELRVFDVYRGAGIEKGRKSLALGLIFQDKARTLTDQETDRVVAGVVAELTASCNARLRE